MKTPIAKFTFALWICLIFSNFLFAQSNSKIEVQGDLQVQGRVSQTTKPIEETDLVPKAHVDSLLINFASLLGGEAIQVLLDMGPSSPLVPPALFWTSTQVDALDAVMFVGNSNTPIDWRKDSLAFIVGVRSF